MRYLVVTAFWMDSDDVDSVADATKPFKAEGTRAAVVNFRGDHPQTPALLHDLARFQLEEVNQPGTGASDG